MTRLFIIRGFGEKTDCKGNKFNFDRVHTELIEPAAKRCNLAGGTTATEIDAGNIREDMFRLILEADIVVCDITVHNANVFYELGIRHALRKKHTVMIRGEGSEDKVPFDITTDRYLAYNPAEPDKKLDDLVAALEASRRSERETDSPVFLLMPALREADPSEVTVVPEGLVKEVALAEAAKDKAWLRVIAEDIRGMRYERDALRHVARAQFHLSDAEAARANWEQMIAARPGDPEALLALGNLYERQFRKSRRDEHMQASQQALDEVIDNPGASSAQRADALAQRGRNLKSLWRQGLEGAADPQAACAAALDRRALESYEAYREAFEADLNEFYAGLAAVQMGHVLQKLATLPGWRTLFGSDTRKATRAREDLDADLPELALVVRAGIRRALGREEGDKRMWAAISEADLLFLTEPEDALKADPSVVVQAYKDAIPKNKLWAFGAASGQLELFARLGIRAEAVRAVQAAIEMLPSVQQHLVVFTGHGIDAPGAAKRFPAAAEGLARSLIKAALEKLQQAQPAGEQLVMLASAAPGADILAHEVAKELGVERRLCLPLPADVVSRQAFNHLDDWRSRFLAIVREHEGKQLQLSESEALPRWLQGRDITPWGRGNRWVLRTAQTWGAARVTLLALWDGVNTGRDGGTSQMVKLARDIGRFDVVQIDSRQLLG